MGKLLKYNTIFEVLFTGTNKYQIFLQRKGFSNSMASIESLEREELALMPVLQNSFCTHCWF